MKRKYKVYAAVLFITAFLIVVSTRIDKNGEFIEAVFSHDLENVFDYAESGNKKYSIYTASALGESPEAYLYSSDIRESDRLSYNLYGYEYDICVNDDGDYAYSICEDSLSKTSVICNGVEVTSDQINKCLVMDSRFLYFIKQTNSDSNVSRIFRYDIENINLEQVGPSFPGYVSRLYALHGNLILEVWTKETKSLDIFIYNMNSNEWSVLADTGDDEFIYEINQKDFIVASVGGDLNARYLFNAYYWIYRYQKDNPWAGANDSTGRVGWNAAPRLSGLLEIYKKTQDSELKAMLVKAAHKMISNRKQYEGMNNRDSYLWYSRWFSVDDISPIYMMVTNANCIYTLLKISNEGLLTDENNQFVIQMAEKAFDYYEPFWNPSLNTYHFEYGMAYHLDGCVQPFNMSNMFGLMLMELYKATGQECYRERVELMGKEFLSQMVVTKDNRLVWHYWPEVFYNGWNECDNVSKNTPVMNPFTDYDFEDISHSGINVLFLKEYFTSIKSGNIPAIYQESIIRTLKYICKEDGYLTTLNGSTSKIFTPSPYWNCLGKENLPPALLEDYKHIGRFTSLEFDSQERLIGYGYLYDPLAGGEVGVEFKTYTADGQKAVKEAYKNYNSNTIKNLAEILAKLSYDTRRSK